MIHRSRGKRANGAKSGALKERVLERAREPVFYDFGPTLVAEHIGRDPDIGEVNPYTLHLWMMEEGLWEVVKAQAAATSTASGTAGRVR